MGFLRGTIKAYIDDVKDFDGSTDRRFPIRPEQIKSRTLTFVVQKGMPSPAQDGVLEQMAEYAKGEGLNFKGGAAPMTDGSVTVVRRAGSYFVNRLDFTDAERWVAFVDPAVVPVDGTPGALGEVVQQMLADSEHGVRDPSWREFDALQEPLLRAAGVKSLAQFDKGATTISVDRRTGDDGEVIDILPTRGKRWFTDGRRVFAFDSPGQLEREILAAFEDSTPRS